jgi:hypothetical protein
VLYRYYYDSAEQCAEAHGQARKFVEVWAEQQFGKEQVVGLVESLWHEAAALRLTDPDRARESLTGSARKLSLRLRESTAYTVAELREYAAELLMNDEEFEETVGHDDGLLEVLADIVRSPSQQEMGHERDR